MRYSEARGTLIYEKNLKSKILCQTPFKDLLIHKLINPNSHWYSQFSRGSSCYKVRYVEVRKKVGAENCEYVFDLHMSKVSKEL